MRRGPCASPARTRRGRGPRARLPPASRPPRPPAAARHGVPRRVRVVSGVRALPPALELLQILQQIEELLEPLLDLLAVEAGIDFQLDLRLVQRGSRLRGLERERLPCLAARSLTSPAEDPAGASTVPSIQSPPCRAGDGPRASIRRAPSRSIRTIRASATSEVASNRIVMWPLSLTATRGLGSATRTAEATRRFRPWAASCPRRSSHAPTARSMPPLTRPAVCAVRRNCSAANRGVRSEPGDRPARQGSRFPPGSPCSPSPARADS